ncbi:peptidase inhibitor family I36 protein [Streptomyces bambusae]|uniref:peptidase inhibitor family I36 protein n=1 Tax=Streptomyces bambusae TaxID=1550616 RepID=UPI001CFF9A74|nr:peptidase inhibitor family I36 protein [Streptomyces bambusae]MCB5169820.1 peptidase inhibitor family I36 protein [Streptomyces bambusae]
MKLSRVITAVAVGAALALGSATGAVADSGPKSAPRVENGGAADAPDRARDAKAGKAPKIATYKGKKMDLAKGWGAAKVCSEYPDLTIKCFDTDKQAQADMANFAKNDLRAMPKVPKGRTAKIGAKAAAGGPAAFAIGNGTCSYGWVCVYEHSNYGGRKLQWSQDGTKTLGQYGFRDQVTSSCNNDEIGGMGLVDYRDNMIDPEVINGLGGCLSNLTNVDYPGWGTGSWNDRADALWM